MTAPTRPRRVPLLGLLGAHLISLAGNAVTMIAVPLYVLQTTGSPIATGVAGVFATVPVVVGGALGGVIVDRFGYRASSIVADLASGLTVVAIPVLAATIGLPFWALLLLVFLSGVLDTPGETAREVLVPDLAELARVPLSRAAGAQSAIDRMARLLGAALAGGLIALSGPLATLLIDAATFVVSAALVAVLVPRGRHPRAVRDAAGPTAESYLAGIIVGLRFLWQDRLLRGIVLLVTATNAIDAAGMTVLNPSYATAVIGDPAALGVIVACFAAGALTGSIAFAGIGHRVSGRGLFVGCFLVAGVLPYTAMALAVPFPVLVVVLLCSGLAAGALNPMIATAMYRLVPTGIRARVFGATTAGVAATMPLGAVLAGVAVDALGLTATLVAAAVLYGCFTLAPLFDRAFSGLRATPGTSEQAARTLAE